MTGVFSFSECGCDETGAFVQYGSYFTSCMSCGVHGPATSWLAISSQLAGKIRAIVVDEKFEEIESVGEDEANLLAVSISRIAYQGKLVRLLMPNEVV